MSASRTASWSLVILLAAGVLLGVMSGLWAVVLVWGWGGLVVFALVVAVLVGGGGALLRRAARQSRMTSRP